MKGLGVGREALRLIHEVLEVLASMLGCTRDERRALGLLPPGWAAAAADAGAGDARLSDMWLNFLISEAEQQPRPAST